MKKSLSLLILTCILFLCLCSCRNFVTTSMLTGQSSDGLVSYKYIPDEYLLILDSTSPSRYLTSGDIPRSIALRAKYVELGSGINALGSDFLRDFEHLEFIRIPTTVKFIEDDPFDNCQGHGELTVWFDIGEFDNDGVNYSYSLHDPCHYLPFWNMQYVVECQHAVSDIESGYVRPASYPNLTPSMLESIIDSPNVHKIGDYVTLDLTGYSGRIYDFSGNRWRYDRLVLDAGYAFEANEETSLNDFHITELTLPGDVVNLTQAIIQKLTDYGWCRINYGGTRSDWNTLTSGWDGAVVSQWEVYTSDDY